MPRFHFRKRIVFDSVTEIDATGHENAHQQVSAPEWEWQPEQMVETIEQDGKPVIQHRLIAALPGEATPETVFSALQTYLTQSEDEHSGGLHTTPGNRLTLLGLILALNAKDVLELGYDAGITTQVLAMSGVRIDAVDNHCEQPLTRITAERRLGRFPNVTAYDIDALTFLRQSADASYDLVFVDDWHNAGHVKQEAVELLRVLRPGGMACFHDTISCQLWDVIERVFPPTWQRLEIPSWQTRNFYTGEDFGLGLVRKPSDRERLSLDELRKRKPGLTFEEMARDLGIELIEMSDGICP